MGASSSLNQNFNLQIDLNEADQVDEDINDRVDSEETGIMEDEEIK